MTLNNKYICFSLGKAYREYWEIVAGLLHCPHLCVVYFSLGFLMTPRLRVVTKLWLFGFALFFIFFFVVHGYRYTNGVGFVTQNAFYEASFWSNNQKISFNNTQYTSADKSVQLFNLDEWCYPVSYQNITKTQCIHKNSVTLDAFVSYKDTKPYERSPLSPCTLVNRVVHGAYSIADMQYGTPIQAVFTARDMSFMQTNNVLYVCTKDYKTCHEVVSLDWDVVCSVKEWLVYNQNWDLFLAELE